MAQTAKRPSSTGTHFSATVRPQPPRTPASARPPAHEPRNQPGMLNHEPEPNEARLIDWIKSSKMSEASKVVAENIVLRNINTFNGMDPVSDADLFKRKAYDLGVELRINTRAK
ncbi:MAG TPA: hypothetical protein VHD38_00895 [Candidatus Paceibacterota bacterium]|jgi:hypothetical protein|nr:hypothetical protein [Candidatus Paceibacterota bacterium]